MLRHLESLLVALFNFVELILMLLLHHGKHHSRVVLLLLFLGGFFFDIVGTVEFGLLACRGAWKMRAILVQFAKVYLDVGPCFVACDLLIPLDQTPICEVIGISHLGNGNTDLFISTGYNIPGVELLGDIV